MQEHFSRINTAAEVRTLLLYADLNGDDPDALRSCILSGFEAELVKSNPKRKVFRLDCTGGRTLYLKLFAGRRPPISWFRLDPRQEYRSARRLENLHLPVIHYLAWGRLHRGGFCLSEGVPEAVSARQYFFQTAVSEPRLTGDFLDQLAVVTRQLHEHQIHHPDFHLGNILWCARTGKLYLADPWGVVPRRFRTEADSVLLCLPWLELRGPVEDTVLVEGLRKAGLADERASGLALLDRAAALHERRVRRQWKKLSARILSGKSKFATGIELGEDRCFFRHTQWFTPPEKLELDPAWHRQDFTSESASQTLWIDSFLLLKKDGSSSLFYARKPE